MEVFPAVVGWKHDHLRIHKITGGCDCSLKELLMMGTIVFPANHGWKHFHLRIHTATDGCDFSLKKLLMMGTIVPETCCAPSM
jgi:hypothetical protein